MKPKSLFVLVLPLVATLTGATALLQPRVLIPDLARAERLSDWTLDGSGVWEIADRKLILARPGTPAGPIRQPAALAIFKSEPLGRVTFELEVRSTAPVDLTVRDVNLVVGYESPRRFYYIHLSARTDAVHNGIFVVADVDRRRLDEATSEPRLRDQAWHRVRLERDPESGRLDVFVDGTTQPILHAVDRSIRAGRVGVGSFDETGEFRNIRITVQ